MAESPYYTSVTLPGARVSLRVQRERGRTHLIDPATGIYGTGGEMRTALADFTRALRQHRDVLESVTSRSALLQTQYETVCEYLAVPIPAAPGAETPGFLTLSQGMRLSTRYQLPAIDPLIEALEHAAGAGRLGEYERTVLASAARGLRRTCRPVPEPIRTQAACWRCPPRVGDLIDLQLPHDQHGHQIYTYLLAAGYTDCAQIAAATDADLARIKGISNDRLELIRLRAPHAGGADD